MCIIDSFPWHVRNIPATYRYCIIQEVLTDCTAAETILLCMADVCIEYELV